MADKAKREQEKLALRRGAVVTNYDYASDKVTVELDINGLIDAKEGKATHVVLSDSLKLIRSDGKPVTLQFNGWYK